MSCPFCEMQNIEKEKWRKIETLETEYCYVIIPDRPATYGHVLVVAKKMDEAHFMDLTDPNLDTKFLKKIMETIVQLSRALKELTYRDKKVEKIYLSSLCETPHLHFHLIPRYEGEDTGFTFLFEKELEEARWAVKPKNIEETNLDGCRRIKSIECILDFHRELIKSETWAKNIGDRNRLIEDSKKAIEGVLVKSKEFN